MADAGPARLARYRSRGSAPHSPPQLKESPIQDSQDTLVRSRSRYKRTNTSTDTNAPAIPQVDARHRSPPVQLPDGADQRLGSAGRPQTAVAGPVSPETQLERVATQDQSQRPQSSGRHAHGNGTVRQPDQTPAPALPVYAHTRITPSHVRQPSVADLFPPPRPEPVKPPSPPMRIEGPPRSDQIRATRSVSSLPLDRDDASVDGGCFGLFKRKRTEPSTDMEETKAPKLVLSKPDATTIKVGGGGAVLGIDAPVSAVNTGDRFVQVVCGKTKMMFPVTPTTNPVDLIKSAATCMSEPIEVKSAVLLEYFDSVGVQRPLRRYEHVRDVMNSWNNDTENSLLVGDRSIGNSEVELSVAGAPVQKPNDQSWSLLFSQKPGKWEKRIVTLKSDGQLVSEKEATKNPEVVNICHLSDFDIYTPTPEKLRKKIKAPKRICYAVKSQQKTSMFESTQNFVHFFCTGDKTTGDSFYSAIQSWRSWYLVHVMGEGRRAKAQDNSIAKKDSLKLGSSGSDAAKTHQHADSIGSHYQLGSFQPLLEAEVFETDKYQEIADPPAKTTPQDSSSASAVNKRNLMGFTQRRTSTRTKQPVAALLSHGPQLADDEPLANLSLQDSRDRRQMSVGQKRSSVEDFSSTGHVDRRFSQRRGAANPMRPGSWEQGSPNSGSNPQRHSSRREAPQLSGSAESPLRSDSQRRRDVPKPLVDLTPGYREPPQHARKGRAFHPSIDRTGDTTGPLIESATSPEDPLGVPLSTDWRARNNANESMGLIHRKPSTNQNRTTSRTKNGPLLDMSHQDEFAQGTLLSQVSRVHPRHNSGAENTFDVQ